MKKTNFLIILVALCVCAGCGKAENETTSKDISGENETALHDSVIKVDVLHSADKVTVTAGKERKDLNIIQENEYIRNNNNLVSSGNIIPYQDGYYYYVEIKPNDGDNFMLVYDDGKGKVTECTEFSENGVGLEYISDDYVYYYDSYKDSLFREKDGQSERVIEFKYFGGTPRYYAEDGIYYTDINEDKEESYIGKLGYDGTDNGELYKLNVAVEQVFKYQDDLWFVYYKFGGEKNRVGRIHLPDNKVFVYEEITPQGSGPAGNRISFNNGYLYYNSSGLNRLNIQENTLEQVYEDDVQAINFTEDSIWFFTEKNLYKRNKDGVKKIMNVKGETEGFCGIWVDDGKIYIDTYAGGLYNEYYQMDEAGKIVKQWNSEETNDYIIRFVQDSKKAGELEKKVRIPRIKFSDENQEELENRINETIYNAATDWMDDKFIKMNTKQIETEITCHNDKYISISLSYYLKANRSKILNNYIVVDLTSGKRLFLKDFVSSEKQLISKMKEGKGIYADTHAFALEKDEANSQLKSLLSEEPEEELNQMLNQCSMEEKEFPVIIYEIEQTLPTLFEKSGFYIEGDHIVIDYGKYGHTKIHFE